MRKTRAKILFILSALLLPGSLSLFAGGFQVALQGSKQNGMGQTGAGLVFDASTIFFNPGGLSFLGGHSIMAGTSPVFGRVAYRAFEPSSYSTTNEPVMGTPFFLYGNIRINKQFSAGLGIYTPFGSTVKYAYDWKGQYLLKQLSLRTIFIQPTFSYKVNDNFGIGVGLVMATGSVSLQKGVPLQDSLGQYGDVLLEGKGKGFGLNAGMIYKFSNKFSLGLSWRSQVGFNAKEGTATFVVPQSLAEYFPNTTFRSKIVLPWSLNLGAAWKPAGKLLLAFDLNLVGWSVYDTLGFDFADNTDKLADSRSPREYKTSPVFRAGAQYRAGENIYLRGGAYFDMTPVQDGYLTPETPDANKIGISLGSTFLLGEKFSVDLSLLWVEGFKRDDTNLETGFGGSWKARAIIPGFGLNYYFSLPSKYSFFEF